MPFLMFIMIYGIIIDCRKELNGMQGDILDVIKNSKCKHPLLISKQDETQYWLDFLQLNEDYKKVLSDIEYSNFIAKSRLDKIIDSAQYLQFASESTIVDYVIRKYEGFVNEPNYESKKNPECCFEYKGKTVNIEVKTPDLRKRVEQEKNENIKIFPAERMPNKKVLSDIVKDIQEKITDGAKIEIQNRLDNKLKDYLLSAHAKFPNNKDKYFNVLAISLDILSDMDEWYGYLFGEDGAFTNNSYIIDDYSNVDAVLLTNTQCGHQGNPKWSDQNCWHLENYVSLLLLDPNKEKDERVSKFYFDYGISLFGDLTQDFLEYQFMLDEKNNERNNKISATCKTDDEKSNIEQMLYTGDKIVDLQIISEWIKSKNISR